MNNRIPAMINIGMGVLFLAACVAAPNIPKSPIPAVKSEMTTPSLPAAVNSLLPSLDGTNSPSRTGSLTLSITQTPTPRNTNVVDERAEVAGLKPSEVREFFYRIQSYIAEDKRREFAELVLYPIEVRIDSSQARIRNESEFVERYEKIITKKVKQAVIHQKEDDLFINYLGVMIGRGEIWFSGVCPDNGCKTYSMYIIAINN